MSQVTLHAQHVLTERQIDETFPNREAAQARLAGLHGYYGTVRVDGEAVAFRTWQDAYSQVRPDGGRVRYSSVLAVV